MHTDIITRKDDEWYTPEYAITPIMKYLRPNSTIWCPFDLMEHSNYPKVFAGGGHKVICTHISKGEDFFKIEPPECDYVISNPPYSLKGAVLERLFEIGKPFAMLFGVVGIFESQQRFNLFKNNKFEVMYFNKRVSYLKDYADQKPSLNPPFSSVYICHNILPQQIVFEEIDKK